MKFLLTVLLPLCVIGVTPPCTDSDVEKLGSPEAAANVVVQCMGSDKTNQEIISCISNDIPGLSSISRDCVMCTAAVFADVSQDCVTSCTENASSPACDACTNSLEDTWSAACNNKDSSVIARTAFAISSLLLIVSLI